MDTRVSAQQLRAFMERAYEKEGFEKEDAAQIADVLMQADLFGIESHGWFPASPRAQTSAP